MERPATAAVEAHGYRTLSMIGRGSQGAVYTVRHVQEGVTYVLKRVHIMEPEARRAALLEAETLQRLQHTAVVGYRDTFVDDEYLCLVMEYADNGDLGSRIAASRERPFGEEQVLQWFVQLALALHHVHERGVLHRDLKTQNVFVSGPAAHVKLGDFGIAKHFSQDEAALAATCVGTPYYMPPELFRGEAYGTKADVWALGCVLYELLTRRRAFQSPNLNSLSVKVLRGDYGPLPPSYSSGLHDLVRSLLTVHAGSRPSVSQILATPFLRRHISAYMEEMLGGHTEAQVLANPALATLRSQLATCAIHSLPSHRRSNSNGGAAATGDPAEPAASRGGHGGTGAGSAQAVSDARVEGALRKLEEERRRQLEKQQLQERKQQQQRDRRDGRACRNLPVASSHAQHTAPLADEPPAIVARHGARLVGAAEPPANDRSPPMHGLPSDWAGDAFRQSRAALHGRRAARPSGELGGGRLSGDDGGDLGNSGRWSEEEPLGLMLPESAWGQASARGALDASDAFGATDAHAFGTADMQERLDRIIGNAGVLAPSLMASARDEFFDVSDAENASSSVRNVPPAPPPCAAAAAEAALEREMDAALMGLSAKERVLAKKELRKRQEAAAREGDLAAARQRYFQERVLADHQQRSQYLGSFVPVR